ncbi:MAG: alpha/beta hydrolase family protein [Bryobacteraceae bacterium]
MKTRFGMCFVLATRVAASFLVEAEEPWERFDDGSAGRVTTFTGAGGVEVPAYLRKPAGPGPFPVVVLLHGGAASPPVTYSLGRATIPPVADFVAAGWAVFCADFRPKAAARSIEWEDAIAAIETARRLPFIDGRRVALFGGSHGAGVIARLTSRTDVQCAVLCAPAALDLIEVSKAVNRGVEVVGVLKKMIAEAEKRHGATMAEIEKDPAKYNYESALTEASRVRFPILIVNGRNDTSSPTPVVQAYADRLRALGKTVDTYFPDNGLHGFYFGFLDNRGTGKPPNVTAETKEAARLAVAFIRKHFGL